MGRSITLPRVGRGGDEKVTVRRNTQIEALFISDPDFFHSKVVVVVVFYNFGGKRAHLTPIWTECKTEG